MHNVLLWQSKKRSNLVISYDTIFYLSSFIHSLSFLTLFFSVQDESSYHTVSIYIVCPGKFPPLALT